MKKGLLARISRLALVASLIFAFALPTALVAPPPVSAAAKPKTQVMVPGSLVSTTRTTNLYAGTRASSKRLQRLPVNTKLVMVTPAKNRSKVRLANGKTGFVYTNYIKFLAPPVNMTVSAAASLTDAMDEIKKLYTEEKMNVTLTMNYGSSGSLQQQIEQGAPADIFISAAAKQVDALEKKGLLIDNTRRTLLKNSLVLVVPKDSAAVTGIEGLASEQVKVVAIGEPDSVPAGKYAKEALSSLGLWDQVQPKCVMAKDVRQVLAYVESGNADAGFVYLTDAKISDKVKIAATADEKNHSPIVYPAALVKGTKQEAAVREFLNFLSGPKAEQVFLDYGFTVVKP